MPQKEKFTSKEIEIDIVNSIVKYKPEMTEASYKKGGIFAILFGVILAIVSVFRPIFGLIVLGVAFIALVVIVTVTLLRKKNERAVPFSEKGNAIP